MNLPSKGAVQNQLWINLSQRLTPVEPPVIYKELADHFGLSEHERLACPPNSNDPAWNYRVRQAVRTLVERAGLKGRGLTSFGY
jgi:hypothetical protein